MTELPQDYKEELRAEAFVEVARCSWAKDFGYSFFVSKSKGRGRKRSHLKEIELVSPEGRRSTWIEFRDGRGKVDRYCPAGRTEDELLEELRYLYDGYRRYL